MITIHLWVNLIEPIITTEAYDAQHFGVHANINLAYFHFNYVQRYPPITYKTGYFKLR